MNQTVIRHMFVACSVVALSGCQFLGNLHLTRNSHSQQADQPEVAIASGLANQEGRDHLRGGRTGLAIEAFDRALASGEDPAASYNGLGVAYARLGRTDLAFRFFKKATLSDPQNQAYAHNLTRLVDSPEFTLALMGRSAGQLALPAAPSTAASSAPSARQVVAARVPGKLQRDGIHQFSLITVLQADETSTSANRSAALSSCLRAKRKCRNAALPVMQSRRSGEVAVAVAAVPVPASLAASPSAEAAAVAAPAADGQRRVINFARPQPATPQPRHDVGSPARPNRAS